MMKRFKSGARAHSLAAVAVASLGLVVGCSAPPGSDTGGGDIPDFAGPFPGAGGSAGAAAPVNTGVVPGSNGSPAATGSGSSATPDNEQTGSSGAALDPATSEQGPAAGNSGASSTPPSAEQPPQQPPAEQPPTEQPPTEQPPAEQPPTEQPPTEQPPTEQPPTEQPPTQQPPPQQPPAPGAGCNGAFFCDGFENDAVGTSPTSAGWTIINGFGVSNQSDAVRVSSDNARSGNQALRLTSSGSRNGLRAQIPQSSYFVRAFFQLDAVPLGPVFIAAGQDQNAETRFRIQGQSFATINTVPGDPVRPANANGGGCPDCVTLTPNRWFCAEMSIDDAAKTATLWIDGVEAAVAGPDAFFDQPAQPFVYLGNWGLQGGMTGAWIDDVVIGPQRIGCN